MKNKLKQLSEISTVNHAIKSWLLLVFLTLTSVYLIDFVESRTLYIISALIIVAFKGQQIIDVFMELNKAPKKWRYLMLSYILLLPFIVGIIYLAV